MISVQQICPICNRACYGGEGIHSICQARKDAGLIPLGGLLNQKSMDPQCVTCGFNTTLSTNLLILKVDTHGQRFYICFLCKGDK